ncbi:unnamed protein product [Caenorhabditis sp. 36 PRJEB53466]|nr:unnamed protein product [Caenorhabditis sp. 36 PRJEB53466]
MKSIFHLLIILLALMPLVLPVSDAEMRSRQEAKHERNLADPFDFRYHTLRRFNYARTIIASGDLEKFFETLALLRRLPSVGPASNMYKLKWNRTLEQMAYKKAMGMVPDASATKGLKNSGTDTGGNPGFYWAGDLVDALIEVVKGFGGQQLVDMINKYQKLIETIVIIIWMAVNYPLDPFHYPRDKHGSFGATEILHAKRYEVGCYSRVIFSYCVLGEAEYDGRLFKRSASCVECPDGSQCEWFREDDGSYREGNLCILDEKYLKAKADNASGLNFTSTMTSDGCRPEYLIVFGVVLVLCLRFWR